MRSDHFSDFGTLSYISEVGVIVFNSTNWRFRVDRKWPDYRAFCDRLFFATSSEVPPEIFPEECGLFIADAYGAAMIREAPEHRLAPATRKAITLSFSRIAAARLMQAEWAADRLGMANPNQADQDEPVL